MKGIVFIELLNMIKTSFGEDMVDDILDNSTLASGGAYTSAAIYDHREMLEIVKNLSLKTQISEQDLIHTYGHYLFFRFHEMMPQFFEKPKNTFEFLESVDQTIHAEVKKLYPDAALPQFKTRRISENELEMVYQSRCPFSDFAEGLIAGCIDHFLEMISIEAEDNNTPTHFSRIFRLTRYGA